LSFYFSPDLSAGSFRTTALVNALKQQMPADGKIDVITTLPNRYNSFLVNALQEESSNCVSITRIGLTPHQSGMLDQARAFFSYANGVMRKTSKNEYDLVFATSSRLMTAVLGAWVARKKRTLLYLDLRDIFADTIKDILPASLVAVTKPIISLLERWTLNRAWRVNLVSEGFSGYFQNRYPKQNFTYFTNGIDDEFISLHISKNIKDNNKKTEVLYAGNLGEGQGLHAIIPALAKRMQGEIHFKIIGDGGRKELLRQAILDADLDNVELLPPVNRLELIKAYQTADVLFLHLNDYDAFKKVLPSKIFEYGALGKPIWAGVAGYAATFVRTELDNAVVFHPCDVINAEQVFNELRIENKFRDSFVSKFSRQNIMRKMVADIFFTYRSFLTKDKN
jgi:hypothetical protein